jgi:hypothetical protein
MRNTCLLIIICFSFIIKTSFGQQEDFSGQAQLNPYAVNPAAISNTENLQMMLGGSYYLSYVPVNLNLDFTADARYSPNETGSSFMLRYNKVYEHQYFNSEKLSIGYAYRYGISRNKSISAGISMSHYNYDYDFTIHDISGTDYDKFTGGGLTTSPGVLIKLNRLSISASTRLSFNR